MVLSLARCRHRGPCLFLLLALASFVACAESRALGDEPPAGSEYTFVALGDNRDGVQIFSALAARAVSAGEPAFAVHLGDMITNPARTEQWAVFSRVARLYFHPDRFYPIVGNHDVEDAASLAIFRAVFPAVPEEGYVTHLLRDCFCVFGNSEDLEVHPGVVGPVQTAWLESQLGSEAAQSARFRLVFLHRPPFPQNQHRADPLEPAEALHSIFVAHRVTAVLSGHEHSYSRTVRDGLTYIVSGGAGSPVYGPAGPDASFYHYLQASYFGDHLRFRVVDLFGDVRDDFDIGLP